MALTHTEQFFEALGRSRQVLVVLPKHPEVDHVAAAAGLLTLLRKQKKSADVVTEKLPDISKLDFLPHIKNIRSSIPPLSTMKISLPIKDVPVSDLSYTVTDSHLEISVSPKHGSWKTDELQAEMTDFKFDTIITIGAADLDALGSIYDKQPDIFFKVPIINIDHNPANEHFGAMNYVDLTASSVTEVLYRLISKKDRTLIDPEMATALLTGMIAKSKRFTSAHIAPDSLAAAAELVGLGADREKIVHNLYRTRSVSTLRLWGRALARLKSDPARKLVWTVLTRQDFALAGAAETDLTHVLDELIASSPDAQVALLLYEENEKHIYGILDAKPPHNAMLLAKGVQANGNPTRVRFSLENTSLASAESTIVKTLQAEIPTQ